MSLKDTIVQWSEGVDMALKGKSEEAIGIWTAMQDPGARIFFNIASMHLLLGNLDKAEKNLDLAIQKDPHLSLAYFQRGSLYLQKESYYEALRDLDTSIKTLRGNQLIDYKQLGLQYKLYACEVMYNHACGLYHSGRMAEAKEELEKAMTCASKTSESRHKIITAALDNIKTGTKFQPYKLPDTALVFQPPRNKREVLKPVNFLGKAKVLSSVVDQDSYVGFVGVQDEKQKHSRSPSPRVGVTPPPPSYGKSHSHPHAHASSPVMPPKPAKPALPPPARVPKPDGPPPPPAIKIGNRRSSLQKTEVAAAKAKASVAAEFKKVNVGVNRPPKPCAAPPPLHNDVGKGKPPVGHSKSLEGVTKHHPKKITGQMSKTTGMMTVKVHYCTTRAVRVSTSITYQQLQNLICKKFDQAEASLTLWCKKKSGELNEINSEQSLKEVCIHLDDGFRLTLWAYDKQEEASPEPDMEVEEVEDPILLECVATHGYKGMYEDELSFNSGDRVDVTADINTDWYEGRCNGVAGIFPKSYVKVI